MSTKSESQGCKESKTNKRNQSFQQGNQHTQKPSSVNSPPREVELPPPPLVEPFRNDHIEEIEEDQSIVMAPSLGV